MSALLATLAIFKCLLPRAAPQMALAGLEGAFPPGPGLHSMSLPPACRISEDLNAFFRITRVTEATCLAGLSCPWNKVLSRGRGTRRMNGTGSVALRLGSAGRKVNPDARPHGVQSFRSLSKPCALSSTAPHICPLRTAAEIPRAPFKTPPQLHCGTL